MVRPADRRKRKYEKNVDGDQVGRAIKAQKDIMVDQEKTYFPQITLIETKIKKICEAQGIATIQIAQYINFGREMYSKAKRFSQATLTAEAQYLLNKWQSRGLIGSKLVEIAQLFGVTPTAVAGCGFLSACSIGDLGTRDHHLLTGLADFDHDQYLRRSGDLPMTGPLLMGGNDVREVDNIWSDTFTGAISFLGNTGALTIGIIAYRMASHLFQPYQNADMMFETWISAARLFKFVGWNGSAYQDLLAFGWNRGVQFPPRAAPATMLGGSVYFSNVDNHLHVYDGVVDRQIQHV